MFLINENSKKKNEICVQTKLSRPKNRLFRNQIRYLYYLCYKSYKLLLKLYIQNSIANI